MVKYLTGEEEKKLLENVEGEYKERDQAILTFLLNTGLRVGEATKLINLDVHNEKVKKELQIRKEIAKRKIARRIPLNQKARKSIRFLLKWKRDHNYSMSSESFFLVSKKRNKFTPMQIDRIMIKARKKAKLDFEATPHTLRHTFAMKILGATGNIILVKELLGHKSIATTQVYLSASRQALRDAVEKI